MTVIENNYIRAYIERIERLEEEKRAISDDIKEVYAEAKGNGLEPKILRKVVALRKMDPEERERIGLMIETYMQALG